VLESIFVSNIAEILSQKNSATSKRGFFWKKTRVSYDGGKKSHFHNGKHILPKAVVIKVVADEYAVELFQ